jgi:hypothetical protein
MGRKRRTARKIPVAVTGAIIALAAAGSASAFQALPPGAQVNDDPAAGIDPTLSVDGGEPTNADVVGGALTAGKAAVPWSIFRQRETNDLAPPNDQIFVRSFANGAWTTRGNGTVGGRSSASPTFTGSLNFDQGQDGEAPSIDFAGPGRTVPWATWYENTSGTGFANNNNVFASRFDNTGDANQGKWIFAGQSRGNGGSGPNVPSLNINTNQDAENPSVAGGSAVDPTKPGPWITWQETDTLPVSGKDQIFVERPIGGAKNCNGITPAGVADGSGNVPAIGGFCFQQTGIPRVGAGGADPSLNIDPTRNGVEPDIAFTGPQDSVPWVVWYEKDTTGITGINGLHNNQMVFAAKGISDGVAANGSFHWVAVGSQLQATLDTTSTNGFGTCAASPTNEEQCSLNKNPLVNAEDPQVAAGTMNPANPTVPWVTWDEDVAGVKQVFVSRLVGTGAAAHFELVNNGAPISIGANNSTRPDITFSGNTPYVSWREDIGGGIVKTFVGHFVNPANPTFVLDESDVPLTPTAQADVREPISSSCMATPFNADGAACQGGAVGTPFFLFTNGTSPRGLFADAYQPDAPVTGAASAVGTSSATVSATVNPEGGSVNVSFQFGTTTAYGQTTAGQKTAPNDTPSAFAAQLTGLPAGTTIHYRAVAVSDFGTFVGADSTLETGSPPPPPPGDGTGSVGHATVSGTSASVPVSCTGAAGATCKLAFKLPVIETLRGHKLVAVGARARTKKVHKVVVVLGTASVALTSSQKRTVKIALNGAGKRLLKSHHRLNVTLRVTQLFGNGHTATVSTQTLTFKFHNPGRKRRAG